MHQIFVGGAGYEGNSIYSNFIGHDTGRINATEARNSNFLGAQAGNVQRARNSNFFGQRCLQ
jgi:hypothetical protein